MMLLVSSHALRGPVSLVIVTPPSLSFSNGLLKNVQNHNIDDKDIINELLNFKSCDIQ